MRTAKPFLQIHFAGLPLDPISERISHIQAMTRINNAQDLRLGSVTDMAAPALEVRFTAHFIPEAIGALLSSDLSQSHPTCFDDHSRASRLLESKKSLRGPVLCPQEGPTILQLKSRPGLVSGGFEGERG
jgi:hypothetical protein